VEFFIQFQLECLQVLLHLIVTLQPILTNALSGPILNEKVTIKQWIGVLLGFLVQH
jgi:drug/metabolite transporter (DMT)-like permease